MIKTTKRRKCRKSISWWNGKYVWENSWKCLWQEEILKMNFTEVSFTYNKMHPSQVYSFISFDKCMYSCYHHYNKNRGHFYQSQISPVLLPSLLITISHGSREVSSISCYYRLDLCFPKFHINGLMNYELWVFRLLLSIMFLRVIV